MSIFIAPSSIRKDGANITVDDLRVECPMCGWCGGLIRCVYLKHGGPALCPECNEIVEEE